MEYSTVLTIAIIMCVVRIFFLKRSGNKIRDKFLKEERDRIEHQNKWFNLYVKTFNIGDTVYCKDSHDCYKKYYIMFENGDTGFGITDRKDYTEVSRANAICISAIHLSHNPPPLCPCCKQEVSN